MCRATNARQGVLDLVRQGRSETCQRTCGSALMVEFLKPAGQTAFAQADNDRAIQVGVSSNLNVKNTIAQRGPARDRQFVFSQRDTALRDRSTKA